MFTSGLELRADSIPDMWVLSAPLIWCDPVFGRLEVPVGFRTDLASIPRALRNLPGLDPNGPSRRPAVMHDWLYARQGAELSKDRADAFLRAAILAEGGSGASAGAIYYGVHWFGGPSWRSDAGALETRDFDTSEHYRSWLAGTLHK